MSRREFMGLAATIGGLAAAIGGLIALSPKVEDRPLYFRDVFKTWPPKYKWRPSGAIDYGFKTDRSVRALVSRGESP
jgi:hypothetical protein